LGSRGGRNGIMVGIGEWRMGERQLTVCLPVAHPQSLTPLFCLLVGVEMLFDMWAIDELLCYGRQGEFRNGSLLNVNACKVNSSEVYLSGGDENNVLPPRFGWLLRPLPTCIIGPGKTGAQVSWSSLSWGGCQPWVLAKIRPFGSFNWERCLKQLKVGSSEIADFSGTSPTDTCWKAWETRRTSLLCTPLPSPPN
jgi:hypothetical protein